MNRSFFLPSLIAVALFLFGNIQLRAQEHDHDHLTKAIQIATIDQGQLKNVDLVEANRQIPATIKRSLKEANSDNEISLKKSSLEYYDSKGWYLLSEVESDGVNGIYREKVKVSKNQFFLVETKEGEFCLVSNCRKIAFSNPPEGCECLEKVEKDKPVDITHRLIHYAN